MVISTSPRRARLRRPKKNTSANEMSLAIAVTISIVLDSDMTRGQQRGVGLHALHVIAYEMVGDRRRAAIAAGEDQPVVRYGALQRRRRPDRFRPAAPN